MLVFKAAALAGCYWWLFVIRLCGATTLSLPELAMNAAWLTLYRSLFFYEGGMKMNISDPSIASWSFCYCWIFGDLFC